MGSGTNLEDNMQRRLTDGETERIARAYDALFNFPLGLDRPATHDCRMLLQEMLTHNTTDGRPYVDPPLTDEDARQRPWVMVRDDESDGWHGPRILAARCSSNYYSFTPSKSAIVGFRYARRATAEEIASAGLEVTE
jgi:hypothetical protein